MKLSVAHTFDPELIPRLSKIASVKEVYGKLDGDVIGGGRSSYTLRPTARKNLAVAVNQAHNAGIKFNYLLNGANLGGIEQTRAGQRSIRRLIDWVASQNVDAVTVASPYLLRLVKHMHPHLAVRVGVFALVDNAVKARYWEDLGADTLCISAISCNRDFNRLSTIRKTTSCDLQLIVNANCQINCPYELTHMNMLTASSRTKDRLNGFCLDYCFLNCSAQKLTDSVNYLRSIWIRPEDLVHYEAIGYDSFKIVERSCPTDLLVKRVAAYDKRSFDGNLLEIVGQVAHIKPQQNPAFAQRMRMIITMFRPLTIKISTMLLMKRYAEKVILHEYDQTNTPVYINNKSLDGFIDGIKKRDCFSINCAECGYCESWARKVVVIDPAYQGETIAMAERLDRGLLDGKLWF